MDNLVGQYIEYEGEDYIVVAFDGVYFWLVPEEIVSSSTQLFDGEMFVKVPQEELMNEEEREL